MEVDALLNSHWWAQALVERYAIDMEHHVGPRAHQRVSHATAENPPGPDYVLTEWDKAWIEARIQDAHELHEKAHDDAQVVLAEAADVHEARVLRERAQSYFGASYEQTRAGCEAMRRAGAATDAQIDEYLGLIDRHIATVKADVAQQRLMAQQAIDGWAALSATPVDQHIVSCCAKVCDQIRLR